MSTRHSQYLPRSHLHMSGDLAVAVIYSTLGVSGDSRGQTKQDNDT